MLDGVRLNHYYNFYEFRFTKLDDDSEMFLHDIDLCFAIYEKLIIPLSVQGRSK